MADSVWSVADHPEASGPTEPPSKQSPSKRMASSKSLENLTSQSGDYSLTRTLCLLFKVSMTVTDSQEGLNNGTAPSQVQRETRIIPKASRIRAWMRVN